jgi:hypothetical protein
VYCLGHVHVARPIALQMDDQAARLLDASDQRGHAAGDRRKASNSFLTNSASPRPICLLPLSLSGIAGGTKDDHKSQPCQHYRKDVRVVAQEKAPHAVQRRPHPVTEHQPMQQEGCDPQA